MLGYFSNAVALIALLPGLTQASDRSRCRYLPREHGWPTHKEWTHLNDTVGGRLIASVPLASICHDPSYNATACAALADGWPLPQTVFDTSSAIMLPVFQKDSCTPFQNRSSPCLLGNLVEYAINITSASDVAKGLKFAEEKNIRLVVKNTGHDYLGKSTGKGGLSIWTHNLKSISFSNYSSPHYSGAAIKMGAGVQAWKAYEAASSRGLRVVGGTCPTVGLSGGYTQGGGHSILNSLYGLGSDQALEWEVVTASGDHLIATPTNNTDLYWALSGGGGGTYAVVLSLTAKAHKDGPIGGAQLSIFSADLSKDLYWKAIDAWLFLQNQLITTGATAVVTITGDAFNISPYTADGLSEADIVSQLRPFTYQLDQLNVTYTLKTTSSAGFLAHFNEYLGPLPYGLFNTGQVLGSRLIPRSVVENNSSALSSVFRNIVDAGYLMYNTGQNVPHTVANNSPGFNAVLPAWRSSAIHSVVATFWNYTAPWESNIALADKITDSLVPQLRAITPGSGTYMNEGDFQLATWKEDFYGDNYHNLLAVKKKYDKEDLFYATTGVGSDAWIVAEDGRLCRA